MKICEADFDRMMCDPTREILNGLMDCPTCISRTWSILMGPSRSSSRRAPQIQICPESRLQASLEIGSCPDIRRMALTTAAWKYGKGRLWEIHRNQGHFDRCIPFPESCSSGGEAQLQWPQPSNHNCFSEGGLSWMCRILRWKTQGIIKNRQHIYIYCQRQEEKPAIRSQTRPPIVSIEVCWKFLHKLALTSKRIQASQALRGRDDGQQENVGRPVFDRNQWANGDFFCRVGPSCCGAHLCNKGW